MRWIVAVSFCFLAACHKQPLVYTLARQGRTQVLTPPVSKPVVKNARSHPSRKNGCDVESGSLTVAWHGNSARVAAKTEGYYAPVPQPSPQPGTPAVTISESGPRIYVDSLAQLESFRDALAAKEDAGCLRGDEASRLRQAITEAFPFPPQIAVYLRFGAYTRTSFFDLTEEFLLRLVTPNGANPSVSLYALTRQGDRLRMALLSGNGALAIPETPAYYRYFYKTGASAHNFPATIIGAQDRPALQDATAQFLADPEKFCAKPAPGVFCQGMTMGVNAGFYVRIDGKEVFVRLGGPLYEAVGESAAGLFAVGRPRPTPHIESVRRMFHGKLIPIKFEGNDILSMVLMPGDEITLVKSP
jgi:hypothetical protein